ncbi:hypothetical protein LR68_04265 [Anoxybacillus sp. BCO1]|nr:hypothetical protein LR68_04265 [Anoxybacillus sp. BCO1]
MLKPLGDRIVIELIQTEEKQRAELFYQTQRKKNHKKEKLLQLVQVAFLTMVSA